MRTIQNRSRIFGLVVAGLEPVAMGAAHLALPSSELHDHINCFRVSETHAQLRSECGSYIVRARSLTKLATSAPDQLCDGSLFLMQISSTGSFGRKIHTNLLCQDCFLWRISTQNFINKSTCTLVVPAWIEQAHTELQSAALPTELQNHEEVLTWLEQVT